MNMLKKDVIVAPENCDMMKIMTKAGFSKLHPDGRYATEKLLQYCNLDNDKRVLDVGCGPGETSIYIAKKYGCRVTGIDIMPEMIKQARENAIKQGVSHLVSFETIDAMSPYSHDILYDIAIFQAVLIFGDKQKMLSYAYNALKENGQVGAIELTWRKNPTEEIKNVFAKEFAEPLINAEETSSWIDNFRRAGFKNVVCKNIQSMKIKTFIIMWKGETWRNKIKIIFKSISDLEIIRKSFKILGLFKRYPGDLCFGYYVAQK